MPTPMEDFQQGYQFMAEMFGQRQQRQMGAERLGISQEYLDLARQEERRRTKELEWEMGRPPKAPTTPFGVWRSRNPDAPVSDWLELQRAGQQPTAFARNLGIKEQLRGEYYKLRDQFFDENGIFRGSQTQLARFRTIEKTLGLESYPTETEKPKPKGITQAKILQEYVKYKSAVIKKNEEIRRKIAIGEGEEKEIQKIMSQKDFLAKWEKGGKIPSRALPKPLPELRQGLKEELEEFDSYNDWYNSLSGADKGELEQEPDLIKAIKKWKGNAISR